MIAYHFVGQTLSDGSPVPADGDWLRVVPPLKMCQWGLHASVHPFDALKYTPGFTLCRVELGGEILTDPDKVCAERRRIIQRIDAKALVLQFVRDCASDVLHLWDAPDVVRHFLATGENAAAANAATYAAAAYAAARGASARAAEAAAEAAAYAAAYAANAAARAASAYAAAANAAAAAPNALDKYRRWFKERVETALAVQS